MARTFAVLLASNEHPYRPRVWVAPAAATTSSHRSCVAAFTEPSQAEGRLGAI
jgi:hypothetical protein